MLQAYIDESYKQHGVFVFGGYVATVQQWAEFSAEWRKYLPKFGTLKPERHHYHFKYSEMATNSERRERIPLFEALIKRHVILAISCKLSIHEIRSAQDRLHAHGAPVDFGVYKKPYHLAFRCMMDKFHLNRDLFSEHLGPHERIDFIFDEQIHEKKAVLGVWDEYIAERDEAVKLLYGARPIFRDDDDCPPLQAADLWAGMIREAYECGTIDTFFLNNRPDDGTKAIPCIIMEWSEDDLVRDFIKVIRTHTDEPIYDIKYGEIYL